MSINRASLMPPSLPFPSRHCQEQTRRNIFLFLGYSYCYQLLYSPSNFVLNVKKFVLDFSPCRPRYPKAIRNRFEEIYQFQQFPIRCCTIINPLWNKLCYYVLSWKFSFADCITKRIQVCIFKCLSTLKYLNTHEQNINICSHASDQYLCAFVSKYRFSFFFFFWELSSTLQEKFYYKKWKK